MSETPVQTPVPPSAGEMPSNFIYESEHPQVQMPFSAKLGDRRMEGRSLSVMTAEVEGLLPPHAENKALPVTLQFDFTGFSVTLFADARIETSGDSANPRAMLHFTDPTGPHLAPMRYIINSTIAGDMVSINGMMGYTGPVQVKAGKAVDHLTIGQRAGKLLRHGAVGALSIALVGLAASVLYERIVYSYEARPVQLGQSGQTLRATSAGQITYVNPNPAEGEVAYSISANTGDFLSIKMPCGCSVEPTADFFEGATVLTGTPLLRLVEEGAPLSAEAEISYEGLTRFLEGDHAELVFPSGDVVPVGIELSQAGADGAVASAMDAKLQLPSVMPEGVSSGDTARLRFRRDWLPATDLSVASIFTNE